MAAFTPAQYNGDMTVQVRYIVSDVDAAVAFYCQHLGFSEKMRPSPQFAMISRGELDLALNAPGGAGAQSGGSRTLADGSQPQPGGWNRIMVDVEDVSAIYETLRAAGAHFRSEVIEGRGGKQVIVDDPSGNPVELFQAFAR